MTYELDKRHDRQLNISIPLSDGPGQNIDFREMYTENRTLYFHYQMTTPDIYSKEFDRTRDVEK